MKYIFIHVMHDTLGQGCFFTLSAHIDIYIYFEGVLFAFILYLGPVLDVIWDQF